MVKTHNNSISLGRQKATSLSLAMFFVAGELRR